MRMLAAEHGLLGCTCGGTPIPQLLPVGKCVALSVTSTSMARCRAVMLTDRSRGGSSVATLKPWLVVRNPNSRAKSETLNNEGYSSSD